ncbi:RNA polymerase sigma factor [Desulfolithobacter sp.]
MEKPDDEIVQEVLDGNREQYRILVIRYQRQIYNLMYRYCRNDDDAADLTQEAFVRAFTRLHQYCTGQRFFSWLYSLAVNLARDWYRKSRNRQALRRDLMTNSAPLDTGSSQQEKMEQDQEMEQLVAALDLLPEKTREIVILRYHHELPIKEVAKIFGLGESAVKMRLSRAMQQLRNIMQEDGRHGAQETRQG